MKQQTYIPTYIQIYSNITIGTNVNFFNENIIFS